MSESSTQFSHIETQPTDVESAISLLEITGDLGDMPFGLSDEALKDFISFHIPDAAIEAVGSLHFGAIVDAAVPSRLTLGFHDPETDAVLGTVVINSPAYLHSYQDYILNGFMHDEFMPPVSAEDQVRSEMLEAIVHEYGHALLDHLSPEHIARWQRTRLGEPLNVTYYVRQRADADCTEAEAEDFCDSMALFAVKPELLRVLAPLRFATLEHIYMDMMPSYEDNLRLEQNRKIRALNELQRNGGISNQQLRDTYLWHETYTY